MTIDRIISNNEKESFTFHFFGFIMILDSYCLWVRPVGKRKFELRKSYYRLDSRGANIKDESEVPLTIEIQNQAIKQAQSMIEFKKWREYKR